MENNHWYKLTLRVWPDVARYNQPSQMQATAAIIPLFFLAPLAALAMAWLLLITDWVGLFREWPAMVVLTAVILILDFNSFTLQLNFGKDKNVTLTSSLATMVMWAGVLVLGPSALWTAVITSLVMTLKTARYLHVYNENPLWGTLSLLVQEVGIGLLSMLVAAAVYQAFGGLYPLVSLNDTTWGPLAASTLTLVLLPAVLLLPVIIEINRLTGLPDWQGNALRFIGSMAALAVLSLPFSMLLALSLSLSGLGHFIFFLLGIILINQLIYRLSNANLRQWRLNRELAHLERLSEALLQSSPDASELEQVLQQHIPALFINDRVQIFIFPGPDAAAHTAVWPTFHLTHPPQARHTSTVNWDRLRTATEPVITIPDVVMPQETGIFGDALMIKIQAQEAEAPTLAHTLAGGIYLIRHQIHGKTADSLATLQGLASQIGAALYRAQAHVEMLQNQKMSQELAFAGHIQASFLPHEIPQMPGWELAAALVPARQTSGDFYDFVVLDDTRIGLLVADVADKGTGAALYMALSRTLLRTYAVEYPDAPEWVLQATNERILADTQSDQFVTVFYGVLDTVTGTLVYANAGHNPAFVVGSQRLELAKTGIPLGIYPGMTWQQQRVQLLPGDVLAAYTDGITEAQNGDEEAFGEARLWAVLQNGHGREAPQTTTDILKAVEAFVGHAPQFDDLTLLVARRQPQEHDGVIG